MQRMRSTDLLLYFPLSFEPIFAPQEFRAMEEWNSGGGDNAVQCSIVQVFRSPLLRAFLLEPSKIGLCGGCH